MRHFRRADGLKAAPSRHRTENVRAGFDRREDTDQPLRDPLALRPLAREVLLPGAFAEVLVGPPLARGQLPRVVLEPIRLSQHEPLHVAPIEPRGSPETLAMASPLKNGR
jgi:hypothetical protein